MRAAVLALVAVALALAPALGEALAQGEGGIDVSIDVPAAGAPTVEGEGVTASEFTEGERYAFTLNLTANYTTFEVTAGPGLDLERPRQLVPALVIAADEAWCKPAKGVCDYTLFEAFPNERIWDVDGPARVFFVDGTASSLRLRLGVPGPVNATLHLQRDVTPPTFTLRPFANVTPIGFYQETVTNELALADLQVRAEGETEWIPNPTTVYHFLQRFPVQGLDADTTHEYRILFWDWAGNEASTPTLTMRTAPEPIRPIPIVTPDAPSPNATVPAEGVLVRATFTSPDSPVAPEGIRLFFDLEEVSARVGVGDGAVAYTPGPLEPGLHTVSVEITNEAGGKGTTRWTFEVKGARTPGLPVWAILAVGLLLAAGRRG